MRCSSHKELCLEIRPQSARVFFGVSLVRIPAHIHTHKQKKFVKHQSPLLTLGPTVNNARGARKRVENKRRARDLNYVNGHGALPLTLLIYLGVLVIKQTRLCFAARARAAVEFSFRAATYDVVAALLLRTAQYLNW